MRLSMDGARGWGCKRCDFGVFRCSHGKKGPKTGNFGKNPKKTVEIPLFSVDFHPPKAAL
jgi:hypothetical protein